VLRFVVYPSPYVKSGLLLSAGRARAAESAENTMEGKFQACEDFLAPLMTGLDVCLKGPHQWDMMKSYCLQIVECYGNQLLYIDSDMGARLKSAVRYLITAAHIDNMKFDVERNVLNVLEKSNLSGAPCQEDLSALLAAMTSSSIFGSDPNSLPSNTNVAEATANAATGKGAKGKKGETAAPVAQGGNPTARDALLMLSSFAREVDPFWCDGNEYAMLFDLVKKTTSCFGSFCSQYFLAALPTEDEEVKVTEGSVTSLWFPSARNEESGRSCMFPGATGYILLGGFKDGEDSYSTAEPFLTKVEVDRLQLARTELQFRRIGEQIQLLSKVEAEKHHQASARVAEAMAVVLKAFFFFLRGGEMSKKDSELVAMTSIHQEAEGKYLIGMEVSGIKVADINMSSDVMADFATIFSQDKACASLECHKSVALFFWAALKK
ncbi:unnamed protein product, partial [Symbiodinium microadriaticum]